MTEIKDLKDLFFHELQVLWSCENLLVEKMPSMIERAKHPGLKKLMTLHYEETRQHKTVIEGICKQFELDPKGDFNPGIKGILEEGEKVMAKDATDEAMDAALIAGAQKIEHYEISGYGSAAYYAEMLGYEGVAQRLRLTLVEERDANEKLNFIAKKSVNEKAIIAGSGNDRPAIKSSSL